MPLLMDAGTMVVTRLSVTVTQEVVQAKARRVYVLFLVMMMLEEVLVALSSLSLFTSPPTLTPTTEACSAHSPLES